MTFNWSFYVRGTSIRVDRSSYNIISGSTIFYSNIGISYSSSNNNIITGNNITVSDMYGIEFHSSNNNTVSENTIVDNWRGIYLDWSNNTIYHNNFINNTLQVYSISSATLWDDGYPSGGNYWSDYNGTDSDGDFIGDTPYIIDENNRDNYPLMNKWFLGDVNHDGIVDILDIGVISAHRYPGPPIGPSGYNSVANLNHDGSVDIFDIGIVSAHWRESW